MQRLSPPANRAKLQRSPLLIPSKSSCNRPPDLTPVQIANAIEMTTGSMRRKNAWRDGPTAELCLDVYRLLLLGTSHESAANILGVSRNAFNNWCRRGEEQDADPKYVAFSKAVQDAGAIVETHHVANITQASNKSWQASAWLLERKWPERWGQRRETPSVSINFEFKEQIAFALSNVPNNLLQQATKVRRALEHVGPSRTKT